MQLVGETSAIDSLAEALDRAEDISRYTAELLAAGQGKLFYQSQITSSVLAPAALAVEQADFAVAS